jgi:hypothetical protein
VSVPARAAALLVALAAVVGGGIFVVLHYIGGGPQWVNYVPQASGGQVNVVMQTDAQTTVTDHPDFVSYFIQDPVTKAWIHTTLFQVPANTQVNMTIYGYDGGTPGRNQLWGAVQGTVDGTSSVTQVDPKGHQGAAQTLTTMNTWNGDVQHSFQIASLNLNVPIAAANGTLCGTSPCTPQGNPYTINKFSFKTPAQGGILRWNCEIPCGLGYLYGMGGPMQTLGYMSGEMQVVG